MRNCRHRCAILLGGIFLFSCIGGAAWAERKIVMGTQLDFMAGETNRQTLSSVEFQNSVAPFYGIYPSIDIKSTGISTMLDLAYSGLVERYEGDKTIRTNSNLARGAFAKTGHRYKLDFGMTFSDSPDDVLVNVVNGAIATNDGFNFTFEPAQAHTSRNAFYGGSGVEITLSDRTSLISSFTAASLSYYDTVYPKDRTVANPLLDQMRDQVDLGLLYKLDSNRSIGARYIFIDNSYKGFGSAKANALAFRYISRLNPALLLELEGGPAITSGLDQPVGLGFLAAGRISRRIHSSNIFAYYSHSSGDNTGLGTLSNVNSVGTGAASPLWHRLGISFDIAGYTGRSFGFRPSDYDGFYSALDLSYSLSRYWYVGVGGAYQKHPGNNALDPDSKRIFISLRFRSPDFWRSSL
jgi:hypothetical protein